MRFLVDAQLPPGLAELLTGLGHEAEHVFGLGLASATDEVLWDRAVATGATVITKDGDFAARRQSSRDGPPIIWIRFGNTTSRAAVAKFAEVIGQIAEALEAGETLVEVL